MQDGSWPLVLTEAEAARSHIPDLPVHRGVLVKNITNMSSVKPDVVPQR